MGQTTGTPTLTATATGGTGPYTYQWMKGTTVVGTNSPTFALPTTTTAADAGSYTVTVTDSATTPATDKSTAVVISVNPAPTIRTQPANQSGTVGGAGKVFTAAVTANTGTPVLTYQWQVQTGGTGAWANVTGGTGATTLSYTTATLASNMNGNKYKVIVTDKNGVKVESDGTATLTVTAATPVLKTIKLVGNGVAASGANFTLVSGPKADGSTDSGDIEIQAATDSGATLPADSAFSVTPATADASKVEAVVVSGKKFKIKAAAIGGPTAGTPIVFTVKTTATPSVPDVTLTVTFTA